jgi:hypothetical protein
VGVHENMLSSTKNSAPTLGVDKKLFVREILHVLKEIKDFSLNIWFRRDMGQLKKNGHMKIQVQKERKR